MSDYLWLLPSVTTARIGDELVLRAQGGEVRLSPGGESLLNSILLLDGDHTEEEFLREPSGSEILATLREEQWIVRLSRRLGTLATDRPALTRQLAYFAHIQPDYPDRALDELASARVLIVGLGGIGSHTANALAGAGVARFTMMEADIVEATNLNRQFFYTREDVGTLKVEAAARFLRARHPHLAVETIPQVLAEPADLERWGKHDLIVFAGDGWTLSKATHTAPCTQPVLMGCYIGMIGVVGPLAWPARGSACWTCRLRSESEIARVYANRRPRPRGWNASGSTLNGTMGNLVAEVAIRCLAPSLGGPLLLHEQLQVDLATLSVERLPFEAIPCPHLTESPPLSS